MKNNRLTTKSIYQENVFFKLFSLLIVIFLHLLVSYAAADNHGESTPSEDPFACRQLRDLSPELMDLVELEKFILSLPRRADISEGTEPRPLDFFEMPNVSISVDYLKSIKDEGPNNINLPNNSTLLFSPDFTAGMGIQIEGVNGSSIILPCRWLEPEYTHHHKLGEKDPMSSANAFDRIRFILNTSSQIESIDAPKEWQIDWRQSGNRVLVWAKVPADSGDIDFVINTKGRENYIIRQPVKIGLNSCTSPGLYFPVRLDDEIDISICASGNEIETLTWEYKPINRPNSPLGGLEIEIKCGTTDIAQGMSLCDGRRVKITGTVQPGAYSSYGTITLRKDDQVIIKGKTKIDVAPYLILSRGSGLIQVDPQTWELQSESFQYTKHQKTSYLLPQAGGGYGNVQFIWSYDNSIPYGHFFPESNQNGDWYLHGSPKHVIPSNYGQHAAEPSKEIPVKLRLKSDGSLQETQLIVFVKVQPKEIKGFSLLTQNTLMRPDDLPEFAEDIICNGGALSAAIIAAAVSPYGFAGVIGALFGGCKAAEIVGQAIYDSPFSDNNTEKDNIDRANLIVDQALNRRTRRVDDPNDERYDVIAMQELIADDIREFINYSLSSHYSFHQGPNKIEDSKVHSGLGIFIRKDWIVLSHDNVPYGNSSGFDMFANKGFSFSKIQIGKDPDSYFYLVNTHTNAGEGKGARIRLSQIKNLGQYINQYADFKHPVLIVGDLNVEGAKQQEYEEMMDSLGNPIDTYRESHGDLNNNPGFTSNKERNPYAYEWFNGGQDHSKRLDYILLRDGSEYKLIRKGTEIVDDHIITQKYRDDWQQNETACVLDDNNSDGTDYGEGANNAPLRCSYLSDHYGLRADFLLIRD